MYQENGEIDQVKEPSKSTALGSKVASSSVSCPSKMKSQFELEKTIVEVVRELTGESVDPDQPLAGQGLDSLAAMELRQKLQVHYNSHAVSVLETPSYRLVTVFHN